MQQSESIKELAAAMSKVQAAIDAAHKDSVNDFFKKPGGKAHRYADLASVWEAIRPHLGPNGLALIQFPFATERGVGVESILTHSSGEWLRSEFTLPLAKPDAQGGGSCITYARRYSAASIFGVMQEDDDANAASGNDRPPFEKKKPGLRAQGASILEGAAQQGLEALGLAWRAMSTDMQAACKDIKDSLKAKLEE